MIRMTDISSIANEILHEGLDDWVPVDTVLWYARQSSPGSEEAFKRAAVDTVRHLLNEGLMLIGDIGESGIDPWPGSVDQVIERLVEECDAVNWEPFGAICWLSNTAVGTSRVQPD